MNIFEWVGRMMERIVLKLYPMASTDNSETVVELVPPPQKTDNAQKVYEVAYANIGNHLTLNPSVSPEVGCAEAVSWVLLNAGYPIPTGGIPSVAGLQDWMLSKGFIETKDYARGFVITGRSPSDGHIGICGNNYIMSNTSEDGQNGLIRGRFQANYQIKNWSKVFPIVHLYIPPSLV